MITQEQAVLMAERMGWRTFIYGGLRIAFYTPDAVTYTPDKDLPAYFLSWEGKGALLEWAIKEEERLADGVEDFPVYLKCNELLNLPIRVMYDPATIEAFIQAVIGGERG